MAKRSATSKAHSKYSQADAMKFAPVKLDSLFEGLDAVAWIGSASCGQVAQFADIDPRTAGKLLKNAVFLGLLDTVDGDLYVTSPSLSVQGFYRSKTSSSPRGVSADAAPKEY